jgi:hypothetical protein
MMMERLIERSPNDTFYSRFNVEALDVNSVNSRYSAYFNVDYNIIQFSTFFSNNNLSALQTNFLSYSCETAPKP